MAAWLFNGIRLPLVLGAAALIAYALFLASPYDLRILTICGIYALLVLGFQFVFGHAGAVSLAQATFFGIGGYVTGILATRFGFPFLATFPLSRRSNMEGVGGLSDKQLARVRGRLVEVGPHHRIGHLTHQLDDLVPQLQVHRPAAHERV